MIMIIITLIVINVPQVIGRLNQISSVMKDISDSSFHSKRIHSSKRLPDLSRGTTIPSLFILPSTDFCPQPGKNETTDETFSSSSSFAINECWSQQQGILHSCKRLSTVLLLQVNVFQQFFYYIQKRWICL